MGYDPENHDSVSRRSFLGAVGAAGGLAAIGTSPANADGPATEAQVETALHASRVRDLFDEFGDLTIKPEHSTYTSVTIDGYEHAVTSIPTSAGKLTYVSRDDGIDEAMLWLDSRNGSRSILPGQYSQLPTDADALYLSGEGGQALYRTPTPTERELLVELVGVDLDEAMVFATDIGRGFYIHHGDENEPTYRITNVVPHNGGDRTAYREVDSRTLATAEVTEIGPESEITPQWDLAQCVASCASCVRNASICGSCMLPCLGSVTGVGAIGCAICLVYRCGVGLTSCYNCYDNCREFV